MFIQKERTKFMDCTKTMAMNKIRDGIFIENPVISEILQIPYSQGCTKCGSLVAGLAAKHKSCSQFLAGSRSSKPIHKTEADSFLRHLTSHSKRLKQLFSG